MFIHDAILEACLCGETAIPVNEFALTYKEMLKVDSQSNTSQLREEFQVMHMDPQYVFISLYQCVCDDFCTIALTSSSVTTTLKLINFFTPQQIWHIVIITHTCMFIQPTQS